MGSQVRMMYEEITRGSEVMTSDRGSNNNSVYVLYLMFISVKSFYIEFNNI